MADINKNIAPIYDASETYDIGTIVNKDNKLYTYLGEDEEMQEVFLSDLIRGKAVSRLDLEPVLLWENPSPNSAFAAQTVALDLSKYSHVIIEGLWNSSKNPINDGISYRCLASKNDNGMGFGYGGLVIENNYGYLTGRNITVSDTGIIFGEAYSVNGTTSSNTSAIPYKIYGVKKLVSSNLAIKGTLLWTNANASTGMSYTEVSVSNLANYGYFIIEYALASSNLTNNCFNYAEKNKTTQLGYLNGTTANARKVTITDTKIEIGNGYAGTSALPTVCVPYKLYGFKNNII